MIGNKEYEEKMKLLDKVFYSVPQPSCLIDKWEAAKKIISPREEPGKVVVGKTQPDQNPSFIEDINIRRCDCNKCSYCKQFQGDE